MTDRGFPLGPHTEAGADIRAAAPDRRRNVVLVSYLLGLGGAEKGLMNHALSFRRERGNVSVVGSWGLGPRAAPLEHAGIPVASADHDLKRLTELLGGADVVHVVGQGGTSRQVVAGRVRRPHQPGANPEPPPQRPKLRLSKQLHCAAS